LRKFPYPYKAALAISSDIDNTESIGEFLAIQTFLCGTDTTAFGPGLGLEVGNSFWFYNQYRDLKVLGRVADSTLERKFSGTPDRGISIFAGNGDSLTAYAPTLVTLMRAGYIDALHSYGHFTRGGFTRDLALHAAEFLDSVGVKILVFINHGGPENENNVGPDSSYRGDDTGRVAYHADLLRRLGVRFLWRGQFTHCVGQDARFAFTNLLKCTAEWVQDLTHPDQSYEHDNQLTHVFTLDDGTTLFDFPRFINPWGKYSQATEEFLGHQLSSSVLEDLVDNEGYLILYTHLGSTGNGVAELHPETIERLREIVWLAGEGDLFVTTTSRLLRYNVVHKYLQWTTRLDGDTLYISIGIQTDPVDGDYVPSPEALQGITFTVSPPYEVVIDVGGQRLETRTYALDDSRIVGVPWSRLTYPDPASLTEALSPPPPAPRP